MSCCVYRIKHIRSGRAYYGSSRYVTRRFKWHRRALRAGTHGARSLQKAWEKYGETAFAFEILEQCPSRTRFKREQVWLDKGWRSGNGVFNKTRFVGGGGAPPTLITRIKMSASAIRRANSKEGRARLRAQSLALARDLIRQRENSAQQKAYCSTRKGKAHLQKATKAATEFNRGRKRPTVVTRKISRALKGRPKSIEARNSMSKAQKRRYRDPNELAILRRNGELGRLARWGR